MKKAFFSIQCTDASMKIFLRLLALRGPLFLQPLADPENHYCGTEA